MRACVQRVSRAKATLIKTGEIVGEIGTGVLILLGVRDGDISDDAVFLASKIAQLRIFEDDAGKMNLNLQDIRGDALVVSQFTMYGDCRKGRRPSFTQAARPEIANQLYEEFIRALKRFDIPVATGRFQQEMDVELVNHGPATFIVESRHLQSR
ncbi:MAG: D-tyrosyl-tRNA(Tyr) deacylase [Planctomycetaceae bacterium]|jgi:D-tyrosyl-tRNA(Tyr) deacylase|nr:D-tyrosyl-tRNA(Tyr) deacylase [Planctomycetaceae bacterium]